MVELGDSDTDFVFVFETLAVPDLDALLDFVIVREALPEGAVMLVLVLPEAVLLFVREIESVADVGDGESDDA